MVGLELRAEWERLMAMSGVMAEAAALEFDDVCRAYSEPQRHYHTLAHVEQMLALLKQMGFAGVAGLWAVWYHDYIYEPGADDNEARSADQAGAVMARLGVSRSVVAEALAIIRATQSHEAQNANTETLAVLDADMAILGESAEKYETYRQQVREEFRAIPAPLYRAGRNAFLRAVLGQENIFKTDWFAERYETAAHRNLAAELGAAATGDWR